jgi:acetyltransferase-like isoleucine patch superfamily enzyme
MNKIFKIVFKIIKRISMHIYSIFCKFYTWIKLKGNGAEFTTISTNGVPMVDVEMGGKLHFGKNFSMNNGNYYNKIGRQQPSMFIVAKSGILTFGNNVGISGSAFVCTLKISIGNNVKIGGNCVCYDTDFHSLNFLDRRDPYLDTEKSKSWPVVIEDDVFIGAHSIILKGVTIGKGSIIGAGSVVSKSIPPHEIWGGNPICFIKNISQ